MGSNRYQRGKIYKITNSETNETYVGSTIEPTLAKRLSKHRSNYQQYAQGKVGKNKQYSALNILGKDGITIVLLENYPCNNKDELFQREDYYINKLKNEGVNVINKRKNVQTKEELKEYNKHYYQKNKLKMNKQTKIYKREWRKKRKTKKKY